MEQGKHFEHGIFERTFSSEVMKSEKLRAICVALFIGVFTFVMFFIHNFIEDRSASDVRVNFLRIGFSTWIIMILLIITAFEGIYSWLISKSIKKNQNISVIARAASTIVEINIPTMMILITWESEHTIDALFSVSVFLYFIFIFLNALRLNVFLCLLSGCIAGLEYAFVAHIMISKAGSDVLLPYINNASLIERVLVLVSAGMVTGFVSVEIKRRMKRSIRKIESMNESFARFVPDQFLSFLNRKEIADVQLGDQIVREMTLLFADIRSFTSLSEKSNPQETVDFLNNYFSVMSPAIRSHNGFIDKYMGDGIMAVFPTNAIDAVNAAIAMQHEVEILNNKRLSENKVPIAIGIGIHSGTVLLGTIGDGSRLDTTVIADAVNVASRLESLTKETGEKILVSYATITEIVNDNFTFRHLGNYPIRGRKEMITVSAVDSR